MGFGTVLTNRYVGVLPLFFVTTVGLNPYVVVHEHFFIPTVDLIGYAVALKQSQLSGAIVNEICGTFEQGIQDNNGSGSDDESWLHRCDQYMATGPYHDSVSNDIGCVTQVDGSVVMRRNYWREYKRDARKQKRDSLNNTCLENDG